MNLLRMLAVITATTAMATHALAEPPAEKDFNAYLFTYFTGNDINEEQIRFAVSMDGYDYYALNNNNPFSTQRNKPLPEACATPISCDVKTGEHSTWS